jgi:hypothetical protein
METNRESLGSQSRTAEKIAEFVAPGEINPSTDVSVAGVTVGEDGVLFVPNIEPTFGSTRVDVAESKTTKTVESFVAPEEINPSTDVSVAGVTVGEDGVLFMPNIEPTFGSTRVNVAQSETTKTVESFVAPEEINPSTDVSAAGVTVGEDGVLFVPKIEPTT